jgi:hypothetical protein
MSIDPLAAAVSGGADLQALIDAELAQLAADAQALRAMLVEDAVVTARVLPSNGLTDLLEIAGRRVAAVLPPNVRPGDVLQVRVQGFTGEQIQVQIIGYGGQPAAATPPLAPQPGAFVQATIVPAPPPGSVPAPAAPGAAAGATAPPSGPTPGVAAPVVSGTPTAAGPPAESGAAASATGSGSTPSPAESGASATGATSGTPRPNIITAGVPTSIEARLAAARAAISQRGVEPAPSAKAPSGGAVTSGTPASTAAGAANSDAAGRSARPASQPFVAPPQISAKSPALGNLAPAGTPRSTGLAAYAEPVALLRALRLPVTPSSVASAALALEHPARLPVALAALERALPQASADPHVATLRTLLAFVGTIDPRSPTLAAQIAAYVEHVVDGAEPKLATLLAATRAAEPPPNTAATSPRAAPASSEARTAASAQHAPVAAAIAAERSAALSVDLKQTLLAVAADPATPSSLAPALSGALSALTAVQVNAAQALAANPDGIAFTIPLTTQHGPANAHVSVKRDAPQGRGARLDGENFRIAFVLDTAHYGTVAIDLVTVGREVTVDVRAESAPAMRAFRDALGTLTARLESLRYRVASAEAKLGTTSTVSIEAPPPASPSDPDAVVDRSA